MKQSKPANRDDPVTGAPESSTKWFPANEPPPDDRDVLAWSSIDDKYRIAFFTGTGWTGVSTPWRIEWWSYLPLAPSKESERAP